MPIVRPIGDQSCRSPGKSLQGCHVRGTKAIAGIEEVRFGPFRLCVRQRSLSTADGPIPLSSRAFDILTTLIELRHRAVPKDELMNRVWANVVVEENNLHVQIAAIRRALGAHHRAIVTIPGRGYRFIGDLIPDPASFSDAASPASPARGTREEPQSNLPAEVTPLIGREAELAATCELLGQARLVTLVGPGGVGKTKLALTAARAMAEDFAAGCWLVELGSVAESALVPSVIAARLKIEEIEGRELVDSLIMAVRPLPILLLLDSCEHVAGAVAELTDRLLHHCLDLRILCTSQVPLGIEGEHIRRIAPFEVPDAASVPTAVAALRHHAVRLFADRVAAADGRFELADNMAASVVEICRSLDGIPLAIELAAARVPLLGLEPVRLRIANRLALLGEPGDPAGRHRMLRAAIEWSYNLLPEVDRQILRRLSVFAGGFTLAAAQEVAAGAGFATWDIVRGVGNLVQRSLLTTGPDLVHPRHRILEATRDFAFEALAAADEHAVVARRHAEYFCGLAESAVGGNAPAGEDSVWETSGDAAWMTPLVPEIENLRAALGWCLGADGDQALGSRLAAATARFWFEGGHLSEGRGWLARALERVPADLGASVLIRLKRGLADLSIEAATAVAAAREAVTLAAATGDPVTEGVCLRMLSSALYRLGRYDEAERAALRAFELLRHSGRLRTLAKCVADLCILRGVTGDHAGARRYNAEAQARLRALGDDRGAAICLQYAAEFEFAAGEARAAARLALESVAVFRSLNSRYHLEIGLGNLAAYLLAADDAEGARASAREALAIAHEIEDFPGVAIAIEHIALASARLGAVETAAILFGYVEEAHRRLELERQGTEQTIHTGLLSILSAALSPEQQMSLTTEGQLLPTKTAVALALRA